MTDQNVFLPATTQPPTDALTPEDLAEIDRLARRQARAGGLLLRAVSALGGQVENGLARLPEGARRQIDRAARAALLKSYEVAGQSRSGKLARLASTDRAHSALATVSGALGGLGGLPTALIELPFATTLIFRAVQRVAEDYGADPQSPETRAECLLVFGSGGPDEADDGIDTAFFGARVGLTGAALHTIIARVAPRFATVLGQKLAGQAVPVLGAVAGAGTNYAFTDYYVDLAHVHFGLRRLMTRHGAEPVAEAFHRALAQSRLPRG